MHGPHLTAAKCTNLAGSASAPDADLLAVGRVANFDTERGELVAQRIRGGEVARGAGGGAALEQLGGALGQRRLLRRRSSKVQAEHPVEVEQQRPALRIGQVRRRRDLVGDRQRLRRGEVIGDRIGEARAVVPPSARRESSTAGVRARTRPGAGGRGRRRRHASHRR